MDHGVASRLPYVINRDSQHLSDCIQNSKGDSGEDKGDNCAIKIATWNIHDGLGGGLEATARGLKHMNVPIAVL